MVNGQLSMLEGPKGESDTLADSLIRLCHLQFAIHQLAIIPTSLALSRPSLLSAKEHIWPSSTFGYAR